MNAARWIGWAVAGLVVGCSDGGASSDCDGTLVAAGSACVLSGPISETGFDCPPMMPYEYGGEYDGETWVLCSSVPDLDPQEIEQAMHEGGRPGNSDRPDDDQVPDGDGDGDGDPDGDGVPGDGDPGDGDPGDGDPCADGRCDGQCGDGLVDPGEQCDDANNMNGDGCDARCMIEDDCIDTDADGICNEDDRDPNDPSDGDPGDGDPGDGDPGDGDPGDGDPGEWLCGDSVLDPGEQCDDGNNMNGDGCDARCMLEVDCVDGDGDGICDR